MTKMRCIVIGGGAVGADFHVPRLIRFLNSEEVWVIDNSDDRCRQLKNKFAKNQSVKISRTIPDLNFDWVVIATPPKFHLPVFEALLSQSKIFLIEKPLTKAVVEGRKLIELAEANQKDVYVTLIRRSLSHFNLLKNWFHEGVFGRLLSVHVAEGNVFSWNAVSAGSFSKDLNGGGVLMDTGPHTLDQLLQVFDELTLQSAYMDALPKTSQTAIEANVTLELIANGDIPVSLYLSRNRFLSNQAIFKFERAQLSLALHNNTVKLASITGSTLIGYPEGAAPAVSYPILFDSFYQEILLKQDLAKVNPRLAINSQIIIEEAYEQAKLIKGGF